MNFDIGTNARGNYEESMQKTYGTFTKMTNILLTFLGEITAFTNSLWIKFHSDTTKAKRGFKAEYYTAKRVLGKYCVSLHFR